MTIKTKHCTICKGDFLNKGDIMLEKTIRINDLYDFYYPLLTEKQQSYMSLYYRSDLSLSEIAEQCNVTRQAVYDTIKRTEQMLEEYEDKLNLYKKFRRRQELLQKLMEITFSDEGKKLIEELEKLD